MNELFIESAAIGDLENIAETFGQQDADYLNAFLTQVSESDELKWKLAKWPGEHHNPPVNIKGLQCFQDDGFNIYRLRPLLRRIFEYRIVYAFDNQYDDYYVLAITKKSPLLGHSQISFDYYDYEPNHAVSERVRADYESLGIPKL